MRWLLFALVLLFAPPAWGQSPPIETIPPGEDHITPVAKGQPAPYEGQLFDPLTALRWGMWLQQYKLRLHVDVEREQKMCVARLDFRKEELRIEREKSKAIADDLNKRLLVSEKQRVAAEELRLNPPFLDSPVFYYGLGVVTVGVISGLTVWGVSAAN
jgi:hypothetical protein